MACFTYKIPVNAQTYTKQKFHAFIFLLIQRVLVLSSRGLNARDRHLMEDVRALLPHAKKDAKLDTKQRLQVGLLIYAVIFRLYKVKSILVYKKCNT